MEARDINNYIKYIVTYQNNEISLDKISYRLSRDAKDKDIIRLHLAVLFSSVNIASCLNILTTANAGDVGS